MASVEKTKSYAAGFNSLRYKNLGRTGFTVSVCGFGSYRIDLGVLDHKAALEYSLLNGINIIDTSANYSDGASESLVGEVIQNLLFKKNISIDNIVVVSKGGYIQGENLKIASERENQGNPYLDVVKCSPELWHSIDPVFLKDQITLSLKRLKIPHIDIYLLHNPEYFLSCSEHLAITQRRTEFYNRIRNAFIQLENEVQRGRIKYYGISSNTFGFPSDDPAFTSLQQIKEIADSISSKNHFAVIQLPLNLLEPGAVVNLNQNNNSMSVLDFAAQSDIGVLVNRPLNAIVGNRLFRLADFKVSQLNNRYNIPQLIDDLEQQEENLSSDYVAVSNLGASEKRALLDCLSVSKILKSNIQNFNSPNDFKDIKDYYLIPRSNYAVSQLINYFVKNETFIKTIKRYVFSLNSLFTSIENDLAAKRNLQNKQLHNILSPFLSESQNSIPLSQKAITMVNSLPQISSVLVGMRTKEYVDDVLDSIRSGSVPAPSNSWSAVYSSIKDLNI